MRPYHGLENCEFRALHLEVRGGWRIVMDGEGIREKLKIGDTASVETKCVEDEGVDLLAFTGDRVPGRLQGVDAVV
jgi:hypothetical protein